MSQPEVHPAPIPGTTEMPPPAPPAPATTTWWTYKSETDLLCEALVRFIMKDRSDEAKWQLRDALRSFVFETVHPYGD